MTLKTFRRATLAIFAIALLASQLHAQAPTQTQSQPDHTAEADQLISTFQQIENAWSTALNNHDQYALENILSNQFVGISAQGNVTNRDQVVSMLFNKQLAPRIIQQKVITVRAYAGVDGANIAVVSGTYTLKIKDGHGVDDESGIFTHIYLFTHTRWNCINAQRTVIINQVLPKAKLDTPKK